MVPEPPPAEMAPSCAEAGVLGVLPGIIGSIQAIETIKLLLGLGDPLIGRLLAYDSLEQSFREYKVRKDPANEITWENRDRITVAELDEHCMPHPLQPPPALEAGRPRRARRASRTSPRARERRRPLLSARPRTAQEAARRGAAGRRRRVERRHLARYAQPEAGGCPCRAPTLSA